MTTQYYAHSTTDLDKANWQLLSEHLTAAGNIAAKNAAKFGMADFGMIAGSLHDLGKYSKEFQLRIEGKYGRVNHATAGAVEAINKYPQLGLLLAYVIAGHHAGLANGRDEGKRTSLKSRLQEIIPEIDPVWQKELTLPEKLTAPDGFTANPERSFFQFHFMTRMLFSCLIDADRLDTEAFYLALEGKKPAPGFKHSIEDLAAKLDSSLKAFAEKAESSEINTLRNEILEHVQAQAPQNSGIFSLTVPTGGGKTLTSLSFALRHAAKHGMDRVIYVIPFTSIVEQNAKVFRDVLGDLGDSSVLEHHSSFVVDEQAADPNTADSQEKLRRDMESWNAPIVVTTAVQFFESLYASKTSKCRKLHNVANSVVVFDEAQTIPLKLLLPCVAALDELARNYRSSVVLCTATQPALEYKPDSPDYSLRGGLSDIRELAPNPKQLSQKLKRVTVEFVGELSDEKLGGLLRAQSQVLCIVNNRLHARALFKLISEKEGAYHLTTCMCAVHRSEVLEEIKERLQQALPVRLVSTALIEAGVDVDFPQVFRAEAGLDSIAQAAGRCNREGRRSAAESKVAVFQSPDWNPPSEVAGFAKAAKETLRRFPQGLLSLDAIEHYFKEVYWARDGRDSGLDEKVILQRIQSGRADGIPFESIDADFRMIETTQKSVLVPYNKVAKESLKALRYTDKVGAIARKLQPYTVQVPHKAYQELLAAGAVRAVNPDHFEDQFMELVNHRLYDDQIGLNWDNPHYLNICDCII